MFCNRLYKFNLHSKKKPTKQTNYYYINKLPSNPMNTSLRNRTQPLVLVQEERNGPLFFSLIVTLFYANNPLDLPVKYIRNAIMLCMLEWMRKRKHRRGTLRTRGLRGSALTAYIHGGIP